MHDHVKPEERAPRRRWSERVRGWRITVFIIVVIIVTLGFVQRTTEWGAASSLATHTVTSSCGI